jgi:hypothetical protein
MLLTYLVRKHVVDRSSGVTECIQAVNWQPSKSENPELLSVTPELRQLLNF